MNKYPFNRQWTKVSDFNNFYLPSFIDRLYKSRQMEEMWLEKFRSEKNEYMIKKCNGNIRYLDTKIAFEEDQREQKIKNKSLKSNNK